MFTQLRIQKIPLLFTSLLAFILAHTAYAGGPISANDLSTQFLKKSILRMDDSLRLDADSAQCTIAKEAITPTGPALVFNDVNALSSHFASFASVLDQVANTSNGNGDANSLVASMLATLDGVPKLNTDSGLLIDTQDRAPERNLDPTAFIDRMMPVAVLNRFDLASSNGSDCGEYRVIYARDNLGNIFDRFFVILEAHYPNPQIEKGIKGCAPIAQFWQNLTDPSLTATDIATQLNDFFMNGVVVDGIALPAVIDAAHFAANTGQIRTNQFVTRDWQLREFKVSVDDANNAQLVSDTVKQNPLTELFRADNGSTVNDPVAFAALQSEFREDFITNQLPLLAAPELAGETGEVAIINGIRSNFHNKFNEFQSDSTFADDVASNADPIFVDEITQALANEPFSATSLTAAHILTRADAMTCGGCHQTATQEAVSNDTQWPPSNVFTHVDENGLLSPALRNSFLVARESVLEDFICSLTNDETSTFNAEISQLALRHTVESVTLQNKGFQNVVAIAGPPTFSGSHAGVVSVNNVNQTGYQANFLEWDYLNGNHTAEIVDFAALNSGRFTMDDGTIVEIGSFNISLESGKLDFKTQSFEQPFPTRPFVFTTLQTKNGAHTVTLRLKNVNASSFKASLSKQESLANTPHPTEVVGYIAILPPNGDTTGILDIAGVALPYEVASSTVNSTFTSIPHGFQIKYHEEQSANRETRHINELVHLLYIDQDSLFAQTVTTNGRDPGSLRIKRETDGGFIPIILN